MKDRFQSNAKWPLDVYRGMDGSGISTDTHQTYEQAQAVCDGLKREGFGGQGKDFPISTWVSSVDSEIEEIERQPFFLPAPHPRVDAEPWHRQGKRKMPRPR